MQLVITESNFICHCINNYDSVLKHSLDCTELQNLMGLRCSSQYDLRKETFHATLVSAVVFVAEFEHGGEISLNIVGVSHHVTPPHIQ